MFEEEKSEEYWMEEAEDLGDALGVDTREGSVYMDMAAGHCIRIAKFYNDLDMMAGMLADDTAAGDILTEKAARDNVERHPATPSFWEAVFEGAVPEEGTEFLCGKHTFRWERVGGVFYLVSKASGMGTNRLESGAELIPAQNIHNLSKAVLGKLVIPGKEEENDNDLRARWQAEKRTPSKNGNRQHYKTWCEEVAGVGRAKILPLWGGSLTVKAVLFSDTGGNVPADIVQAVQSYVDPIEEGYPVNKGGKTYIFGDGVGEGVANLGAHFLAESAEPVELIVSAEVSLVEGYVLERVRDVASQKIADYLSRIALQSQDNVATIVRVSTIGSIIAELDGILDYDYDSLQINGKTENVIVDVASVAVLSEVVFHA